MFNQNVFKQIVAICFLSSFANIRSNSWKLHKIKPHTREVTDSYSLTIDTGTVDKTAFVRLNGPPPGSKKITKFLKAALNMMSKDNYAKHFTHSKEGLHLTSKLVTRITNGNDQLSVLPCFYRNRNIIFFCFLLFNTLSFIQ